MVTLNMETGDAVHEGKTLFLLLSTNMCFRLNSFATRRESIWLGYVSSMTRLIIKESSLICLAIYNEQ